MKTHRGIERSTVTSPHFSCSPKWFIHGHGTTCTHPCTPPQPMNQTYTYLTGAPCLHCLSLSHVTQCYKSLCTTDRLSSEGLTTGHWIWSLTTKTRKCAVGETPGIVLTFTSQRMFHRAVWKPNLTIVSYSQVLKVTWAQGQGLLLQPTLLRSISDSRGHPSLLLRGCSP